MSKQTKFVFVTGGVVSSLGKGLVSASIGALMENRGLRVANIKLDPYINVDPGTMNPFQHGEVFVTDDGAETDLDLGHYERFVSSRMSSLNNVTTGQVYDTVIRKERARRVPGRHHPGDSAHHRRDQEPGPGLRRGPRHPHRRGRRHRRRHRVAAVPRGHPPAARRARARRTRSRCTSPCCRTCTRPASSRPSRPSTRSASCARSASRPTCSSAAARCRSTRALLKKIAMFCNVPFDACLHLAGRRHHLPAAARPVRPGPRRQAQPAAQHLVARARA